MCAMAPVPPGSVLAAGGGASPAQAAACQQTYVEYQQCLAKAGRKNFSSCSDFYGKLRACEKVLRVNYCLEEGVNLLSCIRKPDPATFCSKQFLAMRECHRPSGPHLVAVPSASFSPLEGSGSFAAAADGTAAGAASGAAAADWQQRRQAAGEYELRPDVLKEYNVASADLGPATAPQGRCSKRLEATAHALKQQLQLPAEEFIAYKWESLRPRPGA